MSNRAVGMRNQSKGRGNHRRESALVEPGRSAMIVISPARAARSWRRDHLGGSGKVTYVARETRAFVSVLGIFIWREHERAVRTPADEENGPLS